MDNHMDGEHCENALDRAMADLLGEMEGVERASWESHLSACPACAGVRGWLRELRSGALALEEDSLRPGCGALSFSDFAALAGKQTGDDPAASAVEAHIAACETCAEVARACSEEDDRSPRTLLDRVRSISGAFPQVFGRVIELLQAADMPDPSLYATLGAGLLRAFQPVCSAVREPFAFVWAAHHRAASYTFRVSCPETGGTQELVLEPQSADRPQRLPSSRLAGTLQAGVWHCWSAEAYDTDGRKLGDTRQIPFQPSELKPDPEAFRKDFYVWRDIPEDVAAFVALGSIGLYDEAVETLASRDAQANMLYAACLLSLFDYRLAECVRGTQNGLPNGMERAFRGAAVHLDALQQYWEGVLAESLKGEGADIKE